MPEITINELLNGKATIIKNKSYLSTSDYVQPFLDKMKPFTSDFRVKVKLPDQITIGVSKDITYNRVLIEAVMPQDESADKEHDEVIGFIYGLDVRKPIAKIYRGLLNRACTNLSVFDPKWIEIQEVKPDESLKYNVKQLMELPNSSTTKLALLKKEFIDKEGLYKRLGEWVDRCLKSTYFNGIHSVKLSPSIAIDAYSSLYIDRDSKYFIEDSREASMFEIYNAFTQLITDDTKDIMNKFEKTILVNQILGLK
jgi:hypothetical protein